MKSTVDKSMLLVRRSRIHGTGVFAKQPIRKGQRLMQYVGEHISHAEADRRYANKAHDDNHTFLFTLNKRTVIDGGSGGNETRFVNHSCDPNCETIIEKRKIFVESIRAIPAGQEISYDYMIERDASDPPDIDVIFSCRCGAKNCRGTMLLPAKKPKRKLAKKAVKKSAQKKAAKTTQKSTKKSPAKRTKTSVKKSVRERAASRPALTKSPSRRAAFKKAATRKRSQPVRKR
jgi:hypothetical protein